MTEGRMINTMINIVIIMIIMIIVVITIDIIFVNLMIMYFLIESAVLCLGPPAKKIHTNSGLVHTHVAMAASLHNPTLPRLCAVLLPAVLL